VTPPAALVLAAVRQVDGAALIAANQASAALHEPWVAPPTNDASFSAYLASCDLVRKVGLLARRADSGAIVGVVNISEIVRGPLQGAFLGFYAMADQAGRGQMTEAVRLAVDHAFQLLSLHRLEANIQPANARSIALVRRLKFRLEGFSPRYLHIAGGWRDHERWAITREDWEVPPASV
jgi:ribosomal-protein-alanine N-acetyltransferase